MPEHTIIKPVIADKFNKFIKNGRIFFLSALYISVTQNHLHGNSEPL